MRRVIFNDPVNIITGRITKKNKRSQILRCKTYRDENGNIIGYANAEHYVPRHPRNYNKKPMKAGELKTTTAFSQAIEQYKLEKNDPERMAYWTARWRAQLQKGDAQAPINPETREHRIYARLDTFIRAMLQIKFRQQL